MLYINVRHSKMHTKAIFGGLGLVIFSALIVLIMMAPSGAVMNEQQATAAATQPVSYIPNPTMNANITWSTFYNGWNPLEYSNGTANLTLNAQESTLYQNPISVNPADIQSTQLFNTSDGYNNSNDWSYTSPNQVESGYEHIVSEPTIAGHKAIMFQMNATSTETTNWYPVFSIPFAKYPSNNPSFDYLTVIINISSHITASGQVIQLKIANTTGSSSSSGSTIYTANNTINDSHAPSSYYPGQTVIISLPLSAMTGLNWNATASDGLSVIPMITMPAYQTSDLISVTIQTIQLTESPYYIGTTQVNGKVEPLTAYAGDTVQLSQLNPNFAWSSIVNGGYTVAVSQPMQNITESQTSTTSGNYIEQATYQGILSLPSAPDLTYAETNITINMVIPGKQFEVANLNGVSYLSNIQSKTNGTFGFGAVNPQAQNSLILEIQYTASQWNASTNPPSFFSIQGIEYYWWVTLIGLLSVIGLGAAANSHFSGEEETLKIPKGKFGR